MPEIVKSLTVEEKKIEREVLTSFTEEQICVFFLSKNLRSIYQFDDNFIEDWHKQVVDKKPQANQNKRIDLAYEYATMLLLDKKYENHIKYWIRQLQKSLLDEMNLYFSGIGGK